MNMTWRDHVTILNDQNLPQRVVLLEYTEEDAPRFTIQDPLTGLPTVVDRSQVINPARQRPLEVELGPPVGLQRGTLIGMHLSGDINRTPRVEKLLVQLEGQVHGTWVVPRQVVGGYRLDIPQPRVQTGLATLVRKADRNLLLAAVLVFPVTYLITGLRWHMLLKALDIHLTRARTFTLNMVGAFYNTFMPGSTGGDLLKAYYAAKQTPHKARAVISVAIDRVIGLLGLVILGGATAGYYYLTAPDRSAPDARACAQVAVVSGVIILGACLFIAVFFPRRIRRPLGVEYLLDRMPFQSYVQSAVDVARLYKRRPWLILWTLVITLPVHITVVISALLAGQAFNLPLSAEYYFVVVPTIVLVASIPISPQGAGVMEFFAVQLTQRQGATVSEAFALAMSIRVVQMLWNLTGGLLVLRGGYSAPQETQTLTPQAEQPAVS